jgi:hypothetical protein
MLLSPACGVNPEGCCLLLSRMNYSFWQTKTTKWTRRSVLAPLNSGGAGGSRYRAPKYQSAQDISAEASIWYP